METSGGKAMSLGVAQFADPESAWKAVSCTLARRLFGVGIAEEGRFGRKWVEWGWGVYIYYTYYLLCYIYMTHAHTQIYIYIYRCVHIIKYIFF